MSTYHYYRCLQHEPPLVSEYEVTQHDDDYLKQAIRLAQGQPAYDLDDYIGGYYGRNAMNFLKQHKTCPLDIVSENGEVVLIPGRSPEGHEAGYP